MTRCPKTARPHQFRGRAKYRFAGVTFQCVLEEGHTGPCGMEPLPQACPVPNAPPPAKAVGQYVPKVYTPAEIAAGDARYREHLLRRRRG